MFRKAFVRTGMRFALFLGVAIVVIALLAILFPGSYESTWISFKDKLFFGGLFVILVGGFIGAGFAHNVYYRSGMYKLSSAYMHSVNDDRLERRQSEFFFMLFCLAVGGAMVVMPFLLP